MHRSKHRRITDRPDPHDPLFLRPHYLVLCPYGVPGEGDRQGTTPVKPRNHPRIVSRSPALWKVLKSKWSRSQSLGKLQTPPPFSLSPLFSLLSTSSTFSFTYSPFSTGSLLLSFFLIIFAIPFFPVPTTLSSPLYLSLSPTYPLLTTTQSGPSTKIHRVWWEGGEGRRW